MNEESTPEEAPVTVNISEVHADATQVTVRDLGAGMTVWDIWGNEYTLDRVTHFKNGCRTRRSDGEMEWFDYIDVLGRERTFTVRLPAHLRETP